MKTSNQHIEYKVTPCHYSVPIIRTIGIIAVHFYTQVFQLESASAMLCCANKRSIIPNRIWLVPGPTQHTEQLRNGLTK